MSSTRENDEILATGQIWSEEMEALDITRTTSYYYHVKDYRYTSLNDAIAEAKRQLQGNKLKASTG